jgi:hypothetical protein
MYRYPWNLVWSSSPVEVSLKSTLLPKLLSPIEIADGNLRLVGCHLCVRCLLCEVHAMFG